MPRVAGFRFETVISGLNVTTQLGGDRSGGARPGIKELAEGGRRFCADVSVRYQWSW